MAWNDVDSNKPTHKQIEYAKVLLEALYGDIIRPVEKMTKKELSSLIDEMLKDVEARDIDIKPFFNNKWTFNDKWR